MTSALCPGPVVRCPAVTLDISRTNLQNVMMRRTIFALVGVYCVAIVALATPAAASANLIVNGDFSSPTEPVGNYSLAPEATTFPGWRVVGANGDVAIMSGAFVQDGFTFDADRSSQWLDLTGISDTATGVSQAVPTVDGDRYELRFAIGNAYDPGGIMGVKSTIAVFINGNLLFTSTNSKGKGTTRQVWVHKRTSFVATSNVTTVEFLNQDRRPTRKTVWTTFRWLSSGPPLRRRASRPRCRLLERPCFP